MSLVGETLTRNHKINLRACQMISTIGKQKQRNIFVNTQLKRNTFRVLYNICLFFW